MGTCINIFGIEILGDRECDEEHKRNRNIHHEESEEGHDFRVKTRKDDHSKNVKTRQDDKTDRTKERAENDYNPVANALQSGLDGASGLLGGLGSGLTSGLLGPIVPVVAVAAGGGILLYALTRKRG